MGATWWRCLARREDHSPAWFALVRTDASGSGDQVVELPEQEAAVRVGDGPRVVVTYDEAGAPASVRVHGDSEPSYDCWFLEVPEPAGAPPADVLVVFSGHGVPRWALRRGDDPGGPPGEPPVTSADQLAAVRWYPATGEVDQIYVAPHARRRGLASALIAVAAALTESRGLPRLWGDGQRTDLGEAWRASAVWADRAAERTHTAPPMTP